MDYQIDLQTSIDLEIFQTSGGKSLYDFFNCCLSYGGKEKLTKMMSHLSSDIGFINERIETIRFLQLNPDSLSKLTIDKNSLDFIEYYLNYGNQPTRKTSKFRAIENAVRYKIKPNNDYYIVERGVTYTIELLKNVHYLFTQADNFSTIKFLNSTREKILSYFKIPELRSVLKIDESRKPKAIDVANLDYIFRYTHITVTRFFIDLVYYLDALTSISKVAENHHLSYPELLPAETRVFEAEMLFHPLIKNAVPNNVKMNADSHFMFVSGPNMSGKSTFLKSMGIAAYLSHIGFPVPAKKLIMGVLAGIYTTINLKDNLQANLSHFYAEVVRIKEIAQKMNRNENMLIIFDELFRGTNVKDAYDGSLAIISAFADTKNSFYVVSTHILEIAEELKNKNIQFVYLETLNENGLPVYTYKLREGVSNERLGMYIIQKENIIEIINKLKCETDT